MKSGISLLESSVVATHHAWFGRRIRTGKKLFLAYYCDSGTIRLHLAGWPFFLSDRVRYSHLSNLTIHFLPKLWRWLGHGPFSTSSRQTPCNGFTCGGYKMADQWCFSCDNTEFGPFSATQLRDLAAGGRLQPTDTVWKQGTERRVRADRIKNLFPIHDATAILAKAIVPELTSCLRPSENHSSLTPTSSAKLAPWLPKASEQETSGEQQDSIPDGLLLRALPEEEAPAPPVSPPPINPSTLEKPVEKKLQAPRPSRKGRARVISGAIITSQDGETARFIKKCIKCDYQASSSTVMPIRQGTSRVSFFCPKCKKLRDAIIEGIR